MSKRLDDPKARGAAMTEERHEETDTDASQPIRLCAHCGGAIRPDARETAIYCGPACRKAAHRSKSVRDDIGNDDAAAPEAAQGRSRRLAHIAAGAVLVVALALLGLSLMHLSAGVTILTKSSERDGFLMAVGIDLSLHFA